MFGLGVGLNDVAIWSGKVSAGFFASGINDFYSQSSYNAYTAGAKRLITSANFASSGYTASGGANGTVVDSSGNIVAGTAPRFIFSGGSQTGILVEEARTNLHLYSRDVGNVGAWLTARCTMTANATASPDGATNGASLVEDTSANSHPVYQSIGAVSSGVTYTHSVFVKPNNRTQLIIDLSGAAYPTTQSGLFTLTGGGTAAVNGGTPTVKITQWTNGWYLCEITGTTGAAGGIDVYIQPASGGTQFYTGTGVSALYLWQSQLEQGTFRTSPIFTTSATVTRSADAVNGITGGITDGPMTFVGEAIPIKAATGANQGILARGSDYPLYLGSTGVPAMFDGTLAAQAGTASDNTLFRSATVWSNTTMKISTNNSAVVSQTYDGTMGTGTTIYLGRNSGGQPLSGLITRIGYVGTAANDTQLQQISNGTL